MNPSTIVNTRGKIFRVDFIKTDGSCRTMFARTGVKRYLKGGENKAIIGKPHMVVVWDVVNKGYRTINCDNVTYFKCGKITHE